MFYTTMLLDQSGWGNHTHMLRPIFQCQLKQENHPGKIYWNLFEVLKEYFKTDILCFVCMYILCAEHVPRELKGTIQLQFVNCWNLNVGTLGEQQVLLTSEASLQPLNAPCLIKLSALTIEHAALRTVLPRSLRRCFPRLWYFPRMRVQISIQSQMVPLETSTTRHMLLPLFFLSSGAHLKF